MTEQDKEKTEQTEKIAEQQNPQKKQIDAKSQPQQAGATTDPDAAGDKKYAERIEEKTKKH